MGGSEECQLLTFASNSMRMSACVRAKASNKSINTAPFPRIRPLCSRTKKVDGPRSHIDRLTPSTPVPRSRGHACTYHTKSKLTHKPMAQGYPQDGQPHQSSASPTSLPPPVSAFSSAGSDAPGICVGWSEQLLCRRLASYAACAAGCFLPRRPSRVAPSRLSSKAPFCRLRSLTCCLAAAVTAAECCP